MYAVIAAGGKQYRVEEGQTVNVELAGAVGDEVEFTAVLLVDGASVLATAGQLGAASVTGKIVAEAKGPKISGFTYKNKTNQRRRFGHRQRYSTVQISSIRKG